MVRVRYPGLRSHPTHDVARRNLQGFGTIISFDVYGGAAAADAVCRTVRLIRHATSLGAVESTIERRANVHGQEHLPPSLLRLSDANASAGIINLVFRKQDQDGFNGRIGMMGGAGALWVKKENLPTIRAQYQGTPKFNWSAHDGCRQSSAIWSSVSM